ncbi:MAG TPA: prolyl oligopeptidase family serine peptidase [Steroidobacteraceae bacterium]|nr:prolyl oligopeptidase family serine peptidase [Steroidobacteraceae bacterium]
MKIWLLPLAVLLAACSRDPQSDPEYARTCHGSPLRTVEERNAALEEGYTINGRFDCIDIHSYEVRQEEMQLDRAAAEQAAARRAAQRQVEVDRSLAAEREGFATEVSLPRTSLDLPAPPAALFRRYEYDAQRGLVAFVTPDPGDGEKHPAILWITGGDCNSLDDFWQEGSPDNEQSASAWRKAGVITMFATLRGGNASRAHREAFFGEVDDVRAAGAFLAKLPYVDADRVYLGGHSTGGTLVLLVAESLGTHPGFAGVFAFGAVRSPAVYPPDLMGVDFAALPDRELRLRSPQYWLEAIRAPTYLIEGADQPGNSQELDELCALTRNPAVHCVSVPGKNHFSVLHAVNQVLAARVAVGEDDEPLIKAAQFAR